jgi:hypothetical protein
MKDRRSVFFLCGIIIALISVAAFTVKRVHFAQSDIQHQRREARYNTDEFRKLKQFYRERNGQWSKRRDGERSAIHTDFAEDRDLNNETQVAALRNEMRTERAKLICSSDLIVRGEVINARGVITDDDLFIYTVYTLLITDVLRAGQVAQLKRGMEIEFTQPGGYAQVPAGRVMCDYPGYEPLVINDQYILQLKRDDEANDYYIPASQNIFLIDMDDAEKITRMDAKVWPFFARRAKMTGAPADVASYKSEIQSATCK